MNYKLTIVQVKTQLPSLQLKLEKYDYTLPIFQCKLKTSLHYCLIYFSFSLSLQVFTCLKFHSFLKFSFIVLLEIY